MYTELNLNERESDLFFFICMNLDTLGDEFKIHDVSILGHRATATHYNSLYKKGLLLKPSRWTYSVNFSFMEELSDKKAERDKLAAEQEAIATAAAIAKMEKIEKTICKITSIFVGINGLVCSFINPLLGLSIIGIAILIGKYGFKKGK